MTVEIKGHVDRMFAASAGKDGRSIGLSLALDRERGEGELLTIYITKDELKSGGYIPGTPVILQIRPNV